MATGVAGAGRRGLRSCGVWVLLAGAWLFVQFAGAPDLVGLWNTTLSLGLAVALPALVAGGVLALSAACLGRRSANVVTAWLLGWALFPLYLQALVWRPVLAGLRQAGIFPEFLPGHAGAWWAAWWTHLAAGVPWCALAFRMVHLSLPRELWDEARLTGHPWRAWLAGTWPHHRAAAGAAAAWLLAVVATDMAVTDLYRVRTLAEAVYLQYALGEAPAVAGLRWESVLLVGVLAVTAARGIGDYLPLVGSTGRVETSTSPPGRRVVPRLVLAGAAILWWFVPLIVLARMAGRAVDAGPGGGAHFSFAKMIGLTFGIGDAGTEWALRRWTTGTTWYESEWFGSFGMSVATAALCFVGASVGVFWVRAHPVRRRLGLLGIALFLAVPAPQWGIGLALVGNVLPSESMWAYVYDRTMAAPVAALTLRVLPLAGLFVWGLMRTVPPAWFEEARLIGRSPLWCWWRVVLWERRASVLVVLGMLFVLAWGDVGAAQAVLPPGMPTVTWRLFDLLHAGVDDVLAATALFFVVTGTVGIGFVLFLGHLGRAWRFGRDR